MRCVWRRETLGFCFWERSFILSSPELRKSVLLSYSVQDLPTKSREPRLGASDVQSLAVGYKAWIQPVLSAPCFTRLCFFLFCRHGCQTVIASRNIQRVTEVSGTVSDLLPEKGNGEPLSITLYLETPEKGVPLAKMDLTAHD